MHELEFCSFFYTGQLMTTFFKSVMQSFLDDFFSLITNTHQVFHNNNICNILIYLVIFMDYG